MDYHAENFVGVFRQAFTNEFCSNAIQVFQKADELGFTRNRKQGEGSKRTYKDDISAVIEVSPNEDIFYFHHSPLAKDFSDMFWGRIFPQYVESYDVLGDFDKLSYYELRLQKTPIGGGYHTWHCEHHSRYYCNRVVSFILYLNDIAEGGETEFLYYPKRIKPETGTMILFPAGYSHTHRGNPPISNEKYIITGWVEL